MNGRDNDHVFGARHQRHRQRNVTVGRRSHQRGGVDAVAYGQVAQADGERRDGVEHGDEDEHVDFTHVRVEPEFVAHVVGRHVAHHEDGRAHQHRHHPARDGHQLGQSVLVAYDGAHERMLDGDVAVQREHHQQQRAGDGGNVLKMSPETDESVRLIDDGLILIFGGYFERAFLESPGLDIADHR